MRELRDENKRLKKEKRKTTQAEEANEGYEGEEDKKKEVDEDRDSKKMLEQRKKETQKSMRGTDEGSDLPQELVIERKEQWRQELHEIEQKQAVFNQSIRNCKTCRRKCKARHEIAESKIEGGSVEEERADQSQY